MDGHFVYIVKNGGDPFAGCHVNKSTLILKEGAFLVALDGICTHGVETTFRSGIACFSVPK